MKTTIRQPDPAPRTILPKTKAARQAPIETILQRYAERTVQTAGLEEDELLQGKFDTAQREEAFEEEEPLQGKFDTVQRQPENRTGLPDDLKTGVENLSGYSLDDVRVHYNSAKPAQLQALAYTQGTDIHVGPGQEKHLPHEAWHVVQQKQGRVQPTMQLQGVNVNDNAVLEKEADYNGTRINRNQHISSNQYFTFPAAQSTSIQKVHDGISEIDQDITRNERRGVPISVSQVGDFFGFGGHSQLFMETESNFEDNNEEGYSTCLIDLSTTDSLPDTSWSAQISSSESLSSRSSSSDSTSTHSTNSSSGSAKHIIEIKCRDIDKQLKLGNSAKRIISDDQAKKIIDKANELNKNQGQYSYKLLPSNSDFVKKNMNCASLVKELLAEIGLKVDMSDCWFITPANLVKSVNELKMKDE